MQVDVAAPRWRLTWQEGDELVEERHALVAALGLRAAALLQEPQNHVGEAELLVGGEAPGGEQRVCESRSPQPRQKASC